MPDSFGEQGQTAVGGKIADNDVRIAYVDPITHTLMTIDYVHHEIHEGDHFLYTDAVTLGEAGVQNYHITTPNTTKWAHMIFVVDGSAITQVELYEGTDKAGDTDVVAGNSNRNSTTAATLVIKKGLTGGTSDGTRLHIYKGGSATNQSRGEAGTRNDEELILKQNTKYILRITSGTASNLCNVRMSWYEHTNKS